MSINSLRYLPGLIYFVVSFGLLLVKFLAYKLTSSEAVFSDAMESIVNVIAAGLSFYILYKNSKPNPDFPYGAGKLEHISSTTEGALLAFAAFAIVLETLPNFMNQQPVLELNLGIIIIAITGVVNLVLGLFLKYQAKKLNSVALHMSGTHVLSDVLTTVGVIGGLFLVKWTGFYFIDSLVALMLAAFIAYLSFKHIRSSLSEVLDKEDLKLLKKLASIFNSINQEGFIQIHQVKVIRSGDFHHIDAHFVIPEFWNVKKIHEEINILENKIHKLYGKKVELGVHLDPCRRAYCKHCDVLSCEIREESFVRKLPASLEQMRSPIEPEPFMKSSH